MDVIWVTQAQYLGGYRVCMTFNDGTRGRFDFADLIASEKMFAGLNDVDVFRSFALDGWTLTWMDGRVDIAPEYLYEHIERENPVVNVAAEPEIVWNEKA